MVAHGAGCRAGASRLSGPWRPWLLAFPAEGLPWLLGASEEGDRPQDGPSQRQAALRRRS